MLAFKLSKNKRVFTGCYSFWLPIVDWKAAQIQLRNWKNTLNSERHKNQYKYITLASIPTNHPCSLLVDWVVHECGIKNLIYRPLSTWDDATKDALKIYNKNIENEFFHVGQGSFIFEHTAGNPLATHPELILETPLPKKCIKWTKRLELLLKGDRRDK